MVSHKLVALNVAALCYATLLLLITMVAFHVVPYATLQRMQLQLARQRPLRISHTRPSVNDVLRSLRIARFVLPMSTCLQRCHVGQLLLCWCGYDAEIRFGVAPSLDEFSAHAWLRINDALEIGRGQPDSFLEMAGPTT